MEPLAGKPVLDTSTTSRSATGGYQGSVALLSSSEALHRHLGTAHVVEVFSNITFWHLASLARAVGGD